MEKYITAPISDKVVEDQTRNSNIHLHVQITETLFSCYDDFLLHSEIL